MNIDTDIPLVISFESDIHNENCLFFKDTLNKLNWKYVIIGNNTKWEGVKTKINAYNHYLQRLPENKIVILSDSRDVLCTRSPQTFMDAIKHIHNQIIVSAEMFLIGHMDWTDGQINDAKRKDPNFFWQGEPLNNYWKYYNIHNYPLRKYINSGLIVGNVKQLKKMFEWMLLNKYTDDQLALCCYANQFPEDIYVDYNAEILHTSTFCVNGGFYSSKQKYDSPTFAELLGMSSYFLHIPGISGSKGQKYMYELLQKLNQLNLFNQKDILKLYNFNLDHQIEYHFYEKNNR